MKNISHETPITEDNDLHKGATDDEGVGGQAQNSMQGQLGHREENSSIKDSDSDFPEPGSNPEHSGQQPQPAEAAERTDEPGFSQRTNQNWRKEDPLAS